MQEWNLYYSFAHLFDGQRPHLYPYRADLLGSGELYSWNRYDLYADRALCLRHAAGKRNRHLWAAYCLFATSNADDQ